MKKKRDLHAHLGGSLTGHQANPLLMGFVQHLEGKVAILGLTIEGKGILGLVGRDFVNAEPFVGGLRQ